MLLLVLPLLAATNADNEQKGLQIAREADQRDAGFVDFTNDLKMILMNRHGQKSLRIMRVRTMEVDNDGDKSLCIFDRPRDVKGTAFLNYTHKFHDDDQWLYMPAIKRVKRISAKNKSGSFMGSEFSYEDISSQEIEKYTYRWIRDEVYNGMECYVIERYPVDKANSGYSRQVVWIDKSEYRTYKIDFYDRKNYLLKTFTAGNFREYLDRFWRADEMLMVNHQNGKSTRLEFDNFAFQVGLNDTDFNKNTLKMTR